MCKDEHEILKAKLYDFREFISKKNKNLKVAKRSRKEKVLHTQIEKELKKKMLHKVINYSLHPYKIEYQRKDGSIRLVHSFQVEYDINKEEHKKASYLFGVGCFTTDVDPIKLSTEQVLLSYRAKYLIEKSFRIIKDIVKLRPVHLTRTKRVKAHVTCCVLSFLLLVSIDNMIKKSQKFDLSPKTILEELADCMVDNIKIRNQDLIIRKITETNSEQKEILKHLDCEYLTKKSFYGKFLLNNPTIY